MSLPIPQIIKHYLGAMAEEVQSRVKTHAVERALVEKMRPLAGRQHEACGCPKAEPHSYEWHLDTKFAHDPELVSRVKKAAGWI